MTKSVIFLVEDSMADRMLLEIGFAESGIDVEIIHATDAQMALAALPTFIRPVSCEIILVDLNLPGPLSGLALVQKLRALALAAPIMVWSASTSPRDRQRALDAGATAFMNKPDDFSGMQHLIAVLTPYLFPACQPRTEMVGA
jgi:DNA-binding response OmpR family regulator